MTGPVRAGEAGRPGRRAAPPRRRAPGRPTLRLDGSVAAALALLVLAGILVALTPTASPERVAARDGGELVNNTVLSCPTTDERLRSETGVGLAVAEGPLGRLGSRGSVRIGALGQARERLDLRRGELVGIDDVQAPVVAASGEVAAGLFAHRVDRGDRRARAVARCSPPGPSWWFVGAGATLDHAAELAITNVDPAPAVVDIEVFSPAGVLETVGTRGITIAPGERVEVPIAEIAPQRDDLVLHVEASRGRVAAAVLDEYASRPGANPGLSWLPATDRPSRQVRLAGVHPAAEDHVLLVGNPSELEALVEVQVAGEGGSFTPAGLENVSVAPGTVASVDLGRLGRGAVAVRLRSRVPVVAAVRSTRGPDATYAGSVAPLAGPAAVPVVPGRTELQLTAGPVPAVARVTGYAADGVETGQEELDVDPTATATWRPPRGTVYVVTEPLEGAVHGAATYSRPGLAQTALTALPVRVRQPHVAPGP
jgi:hypothetical protein